jgi:hypothetical protein
MLLAKLTREMPIVRKIKVAKPVPEMLIVVNLMVEVFQINQDVTPEPEFADLVPSMPIVLPVHRTVEKMEVVIHVMRTTVVHLMVVNIGTNLTVTPSLALA